MGSRGEVIMQDITKVSWWSLPKEKLIQELSIDTKIGLTQDQVKKSRKHFGSNIVEKIEPMSNFALLLEGIKEPMMLLLLTIAGLSLIFGKIGEAFTMIFVVAAYIFVEFINKRRTDRIITNLRKLTIPTTKVLREGEKVEIPTTEVVVGDILILYEGTMIPADARLIESYSLMVNEASLTGESLPVLKSSEKVLAEKTVLAERVNTIFSGTVVLTGEGLGVVYSIGEQTEFGKIFKIAKKSKKEKTLLQEMMKKLVKILAIAALIISAIIPILGFLRGLNLQEMVLTWLSLTFLMIPGQPPIIITMALALAAFELTKKNVIVKRLHGAELMGQITAVLSDKTGTITENTMKVEKIILEDGEEKLPKELSKDIKEKILLAVPRNSNDPADRAIEEAIKSDFSQEFSLIDFLGYSEKKPWRLLIYKKNSENIQFISGPPEILIPSSDLSSAKRKILKEKIDQEANFGKRLLMLAFDKNSKDETKLKNIKIIGSIVLSDNVRKGIKETIYNLQKAGVETFIVTGDHPLTTLTIMKEIGLIHSQKDIEVNKETEKNSSQNKENIDNDIKNKFKNLNESQIMKDEELDQIVEGEQLEKMDNKELSQIINKIHVFARVNPTQKVRLVKMLHSKRKIIAVIGDGVNDAPALKTAQVGIAMGEIGTDLAKEVSDLILTDDNYVHIIDTIKIGRKALDNFRKGLTYYLSAKAILLFIFLIPLILGIPFPFAPIHIIIIELLMDLASSIIFISEVAEPNIMDGPARNINKYLKFPLIYQIIKNSLGLILGISFIYFYIYFTTHNVVLAQTAAFITWLLGHTFLALNLKQEGSLIKRGIFANRFANFWFLGMILFSILITIIPFLNHYLHTTTLTLIIWSEILFVAFVSTFWIELKKYFIFLK